MNHHLRKPTTRFIFLTIAMSSIFLLLLSIFLFFSLSAASHHRQTQSTQTPSASSLPKIQQACKATRYPDNCVTTLSKSIRVPSNPTPQQIIQSAILVSGQSLKTGQSMVKNILDTSADNQNRTNAANTCLQVLSYSDYRTSLSSAALTRGGIKDARAWMSAALGYQYDCWSGLKYVNDTTPVVKTMEFLDFLIGLTSNALSMMLSYDNFGDAVGSWIPPATERDGFWEKPGSNDDKQTAPRYPLNLKTDVTVCKDGSNGCYKTVQEAVNAVPDNGTRRFVILIKTGVYEETVRIPLEKKKVVFLGEGMGKTVITGSLNVGQPGMTTYNSATVGVVGDGFMAKDITFQNTAGPDAHQAVAFRSDSDLSLIQNCEFLGNQDTLYAHSLRQYYKSCKIQGNVDFIFGNSASVFEDCQILIAPRQLNPEKGETNAVSAVGRTDPAQTTGFVFRNCSIDGTEAYMKLYRSKPAVHKNFLGRPWKEYSRTVFVQCKLGDLIRPEGWLPWTGDFALKTLYNAEFESSGPGSNVSGRVPWSSQVPKEHVAVYSVQNFIQERRKRHFAISQEETLHCDALESDIVLQEKCRNALSTVHIN